MDLYASHIPMLAACVAETAWDVLEHGAGDYSTPLLHVLCASPGPRRTLVTVEADAGWLVRFAHLAGPRHLLVADPDDVPAPDGDRWSVAFVDNRPARARADLVRSLRTAARIVVVHDTEPAHANTYRWGDALDGYRHRIDDRTAAAWTTALADDDDLGWLANALPHLARIR